MLTLLGSLLGFLSSTFPDLIKLFQDKRDKKHELEILAFQAKNAGELHKYEMQMQNIANAQNIDLAGIQFAQTVDNNIKEIKSEFVQSLNAIVRPLIALGFFVLYCILKFIAFNVINHDATPVFVIYQTLWTEEDAAIFAGIISFYFGNRAFSKARKNES